MFRKILVPVDPGETDFAVHAIETAVGLARQSGGEVRLLAVTPVVGGYVTEFLPPDFEDQLESQTRDKLGALIQASGQPASHASVTTRIGSVYHEVVDEAAEWKADLIVVSSHRPSMATYLIGSNAAKIVRHAPCSVMVVRD
ncbi:universal stress protein UspA [Prosthecomicrobium hirschii]|uniref:Universal stress protein UspA n=1 Tax=Prosthecodimorpha hirschii TaxID=665126 RepID=A0A0P6W1Y5_9HYPH|nr:universal stress protein [Prosthecomicrobium hirschii]KPL51754.1 universal stress protein UspA [Prosthecomicrobium hirschii]TPQ46169.1 universal stress protein UspA [Prosthecomicrobium hirschii]